MVEPWLLLSVVGALVGVGFLTALIFERWRVPDFFLLMLIGIVVGPAGLSLLPPSTMGTIAGLAPHFTALAIAFLLFEGGLRIPLRGLGGPAVLILLHTGITMALTFGAVVVLGTALLGLPLGAMVVLAVAVIGPAASIVVSVAPRLNLDPRTFGTVMLEAVITNVIAFILVTSVLRPDGGGGAAWGWRSSRSCSPSPWRSRSRRRGVG